MKETKSCLECSFPIYGRSDKKFCSDACRTRFNNDRIRHAHLPMKEINRILKNNRNILQAFLSEGKKTTTRRSLEDSGFDFTYFTHLLPAVPTGKGFVCYDMAYIEDENSTIRIFNKDNSSFN